jgi:hypothetical protein
MHVEIVNHDFSSYSGPSIRAGTGGMRSRGVETQHISVFRVERTVEKERTPELRRVPQE